MAGVDEALRLVGVALRAWMQVMENEIAATHASQGYSTGAGSTVAALAGCRMAVTQAIADLRDAWTATLPAAAAPGPETDDHRLG